MSSVAQQHSSSDPFNPQKQLTILCAWSATALAFASFLLVLFTLVVPLRLPGKPGWPEAVLLLTATLSTLVSLSYQLPGQNVLLAAVIIGIIGGILHGVGAATAIPFGPFSYTDEAGPRVLGVAWPIPLIWIIAILNSRGVARLILRPWRKLRNYGFWLIGITALLTVLFDTALEPFAARVKHFWLWQPTKFPLAWHGAPLVNFLGWLVTALLILAFATPALISKQTRSKKSPPDYHPLALWMLTLTLFITAEIASGLWLAATFGILTSLGVTLFAIRGARW